MPAMAPFDKQGGLLSLADADVLVGVDTGRELVVEGVGIELTLNSLVVDVDVDVKVKVDVDFDDAVVVSNIAAPLVLLDSFAATMLLLGQPSSLLQASIKQQPMKGVSKLEQVYQSPLPTQDWVLMFSYVSVSKLEYLRSLWGQWPEPSAHGSDAQHPRNWSLLSWQT